MIRTPISFLRLDVEVRIDGLPASASHPALPSICDILVARWQILLAITCFDILVEQMVVPSSQQHLMAVSHCQTFSLLPTGSVSKRRPIARNLLAIKPSGDLLRPLDSARKQCGTVFKVASVKLVLQFQKNNSFPSTA